ncbi:hypothetical protein BC829DRAFT_435900 [Chytridium lagenaria]|nr:hypothetical protein BC829DRAFT_435900 [Chytridium lagenaria]
MADERVDLMVVADREFLAWVGSRNLAFLVAVLGNSRLRRDLRISENRHRVVDGERMDVDGNKYLDRLLWIRYELFGDEMTLLDFQNLLNEVLANVLTFAVAHGLDDLAEFLLGHENLGHWARPDHLILAIEKKSMNAVKAILSVAPMTSACVNAAICKARDVGDDEIVIF